MSYKPPLSGDLINQIICLLELEEAAGRRPSHKIVANTVGCNVWQSRYYWRRHLRHRALRGYTGDYLDLKRAVADAVKAMPSAPPYKPPALWRDWSEPA